MATALIKIDAVVGSDTDLELGNQITFSNDNDTGVSSWQWTLEDQPAASSATLDTPTASTTTFTPDVEGTYLVSLNVNTGEDTDQIDAAVRTLRARIRVPAAGERTEEDATRGWAVSRNRDLFRLNRLLQAGGVQVGLIPSTETPPDATSWKRGNVVAASAIIDIDPSAGGTHLVPVWRKPSTIIGAAEKIQLIGVVLEDTDGLTSFDEAVANVPGVTGHVVNACINGYVDGVTGSLDFTDAGNYPHGTPTVGDPLFLETDNGNVYELINFNDDFGTSVFAGGASANHLEYDTENYFIGFVANNGNPGAVFVTNDFIGEHRTSPIRFDNGIIVHSMRLGGATNTVGDYGGTIPLNAAAGAIEVECFDISNGTPTTFSQFDIVSLRPSDPGSGNHRNNMVSALLADESDNTTHAYLGMISDVGQAPSTGRNMKATIVGCVTGCAAAFPGGASNGEVLYVDPSNPGKLEQLSALSASDTRIPAGKIISTTVLSGIFVVGLDTTITSDDEWQQGSGLFGGRMSATDILYPTDSAIGGVGWLEQAAGTGVDGDNFIVAAQRGSDASGATAASGGGGAGLFAGYGGDGDASNAAGTAQIGGAISIFGGDGGGGEDGANPQDGATGGNAAFTAGQGGAGDKTAAGAGGFLAISGGIAGVIGGGAGAYDVSGSASGLLTLGSADGGDGLNGGTGTGVADGGDSGTLTISTGDGGDGDDGAASSTGIGGNVGTLSLIAGNAGVSAAQSPGTALGGDGGDILIQAGDSSDGVGAAGSAGGDIQLIGGTGSIGTTDGDGGLISLTAGDAKAGGDGDGGDIDLSAGASQGFGLGGGVAILGGSSGSAVGGDGAQGGGINLTGGTGGITDIPNTTGDGGGISINGGQAGNAGAGRESGDGGSITIAGGDGDSVSAGNNLGGAGVGGSLTLNSGAGAIVSTGSGNHGCDGGALNVSTGDGSNANAVTFTFAGGDGGAISIIGGNAGDAEAPGSGNTGEPGGDGASITISAGDGGDGASIGSGNGDGGLAGAIAITAGDGGDRSSSGTPADGGSITINVGTAGAAAVDGVLNLVTSGVGGVRIGSGTPAIVSGAGILYVTSDVEVDGIIYPTGGIEMSRIGASTFWTVQHSQDVFNSAGWVSGGVTTDVGSGNIDVAAGTGAIRATDSAIVELLYFDWLASTGIAIPSDTVRFVGVEYNFGTPQVVVKTNDTWDYNTEFPLSVIVNEAGTLHLQDHTHSVGDASSRMIQRTHDVNHISRNNHDGGLILGETGTRNITVTTGDVWVKLNKSTVAAINTSGADRFDRYYRDNPTGWIKQSTQAQWDNAQYDDGSGTLDSLTVNWYSVQYFYIEPDGGLVSIYGQLQSAVLSDIENDSPPTTVPLRLQEHGLLIGRLIFQEGNGTATAIESAFDTVFPPAAVVNHNDLANLTIGDPHTQYPYLLGRAGGITQIGGTASGDDYILKSTSDVTKGNVEIQESTFVFTGTAGSWTTALADSALTQVGTGLVTFTGAVAAQGITTDSANTWSMSTNTGSLETFTIDAINAGGGAARLSLEADEIVQMTNGSSSVIANGGVCQMTSGAGIVGVNSGTSSMVGTTVTITPTTSSTWSVDADNAAAQILSIDVVNIGAGEGQLVLSADDQININDGALDLQLDAGVVTETGMVSLDLTPSGDLTLRGGASSLFGDDVAYWRFDGIGNVSEVGMLGITISPAGLLALTAGSTSTWSVSANSGTTQTLTIDSSNAGVGEGRVSISADDQITLNDSTGSLILNGGVLTQTGFTNITLNPSNLLTLTTAGQSTWGMAADASGGRTLTIDASNAGAGEGKLALSADDEIDINDGTMNLEFNGGVITESAMVSINLTPSGAMTMRGGGVSQFGDDTGYFSFNGSGAVSETGITTFALTPTDHTSINLVANSTSTKNLKLDATNAGTGEGHLQLYADDQIDINDGIMNLKFNGGVITESAMVSIDLTPSDTLTMRGGGVSAFGDDTGYLSFDGAGAVTTPSVTSFTFAPTEVLFGTTAQVFKPLEIALTVNAEIADNITIDVQVNDADGVAVTEAVLLRVRVFDDTNFVTLSTNFDLSETGAGAEHIGTGTGDLTIVTSSAGVAQITANDALGASSATVYLLFNDNGNSAGIPIGVKQAITFDGA